MNHEIPMEPDDGQQREQDERQMWEQHKKDREELNKLRAEWDRTAVRVNQFFQQIRKQP